MTQVSRKGFVDKNGQQVAIVPNVPGATAGNLASLDEEGNLQDSGKKPADFAPAIHTHSGIEDVVEGYQSAKVYADNPAQGDPNVIIELNDSNFQGNPVTKSAVIDIDSIDNLKRALRKPDDEPAENSDALVTSGAVYAAIREAEGLSVDSSLSYNSENPVQNKVVYNALGRKENVISQYNLTYNNGWSISNAAQDLEDMELNSIKFCKFKIMLSSGITYFAFGSLRRTWDGQGLIGVEVAVLGHLLSWSDQVSGEQESDEYRFDDPMTMSVVSTNLFPTT